MAKQFDAAPGASKLEVAKSTVGGLGGSIGMRAVIDDAVITSKTATLLALEAIKHRVMEDTWPSA